MIPPSFAAIVHQQGLTSVRAGAADRAFLEIWVVAVQGRLFARSWGLSERSWYTAFLGGARGTLRCDGTELEVLGIVPPDLEAISESVSAEYLRKYDRGENSEYAHGIIRPEHVARTMEFVAAPE